MKRNRIPSLFAVALVALSASCASRIPLSRNLPEWVETVYVPMFDNQSAEPGLEEMATWMTIEEFLADGRLEVTSREDADLIVEVAIINYNVRVDNVSDEKFPNVNEVTTIANVLLFEPSNRETPFVSIGPIPSRVVHNSELRSLNYMIEPDVKELAMRSLARNIVRRVITGYRTDRTNVYEESQQPDLELEM